MNCQSLKIPDVKIVKPRKFGDERGFFSETYNEAAFRAVGIADRFVQDNQSFSGPRRTIRGLHFQIPPFAQAKLVRVLKGSIFDVAVDIRRGSPGFGQWVSAVISAEAWNQIYVPAGFAHGFCTLEPDTEVLYKVTAPYSPEHDRGIQWNDPVIGIDWPLDSLMPVLSDKDRALPQLADIPDYFNFSL